MKPVLFEFSLPIVGNVVFSAYFTFLAIGFMSAMLLTMRDAKKEQIDSEKLFDLYVYLVVCGLIGARVLHVIADEHFWDYVYSCTDPQKVRIPYDELSVCHSNLDCKNGFLCSTSNHVCYPPRDCLLVLKLWRGGLAYYGGFLFSTIFSLFYCKRYMLPWWKITDLAGYGIPLGLFWGRLGCFLNGCCFGKVTTATMGIVFPYGGAVWRHQHERGFIPKKAMTPLPVFPTQLYLAALNLTIFFICYCFLRRRKKYDGYVFGWFLILYSLARSCIEIFRDDERGLVFGFLSTSQIISAPLLVWGITILRYLSRP